MNESLEIGLLMKRLAAIDVGTNCALLLVADVSPTGQITPIYDFEKIIRLGDGVDRTGIIGDAALQRAVATLRGYKKTAQDLHAEAILLSGTSAVRDAQNREQVVQKIETDCRLQMRVLAGEDEARLTYLGTLSNKQNLQGDTLMLDIGGGSSEFILGEGSRIKQMLSLNIGSVRFTERFITTDPISPDEYEKLVREVGATLETKLATWRNKPVANFIAIAGTATTLVAMRQKMQIYQPAKVDGATLTIAQLTDLINLFRKSTTDAIAKMPGINPLRAGVILAGAIILKQAMGFFQKNRVVVSDRGLRFGLIMESLPSN